MNKHSVAFVVQFPTPLKAAPSQRLRVFCRQMVKNGFSAYIVGGINLGEVISSKLGINVEKDTSRNARNSYSECVEINTPLYVLMRMPYISSVVNTVLAFFQAIYLAIKKPGVFIVSIPPSDLVLSTFLASRITRSIYIVDMRDPSEEVLVHYSSRSKSGRLIARIMRKVNYTIYRRADALIFVTEGMKRMLKSYGLRGFIIPNGADLEVFKPVGEQSRINDETFYLVFSGTVADYYDLRQLILAVRILNNHGFKIKLLVAGTIRKSIEKYVRSIGAENHVEYLGFYSPMELVSKVFPKCHIGVIPRVNDSILDYAIPAKFYEYIASGLPVLAICRKESELAKMILSYDVGWVCEYGDIGCILRVLREIYLNRSLIEEKKQRALMLRGSIDRNIHAQMLIKLVNLLLQRKHSLK
jgi:glycosyltransferase involved in cell wall biosynthesis